MKAIISVALLLFILPATLPAAASHLAVTRSLVAVARLPAINLQAGADSSQVSGLPADSSVVQARVPSTESLRELKADKAFSYLEGPSVVNSWWERFWIWLGQQFGRALSDGEGFSFWNLLFTTIIPWMVALAAIILVVTKVLGISPDALIRKKAVSAGVSGPLDEDGREQENFDELLDESLRRGDFRLAIRLYYLDILRQLSGAGLIEWHPDKTNRQYLRELNNKYLRERFGRLTRVFEYVWYGETDPGESEFEAAKAEFHALKGRLGTNSDEKN